MMVLLLLHGVIMGTVKTVPANMVFHATLQWSYLAVSAVARQGGHGA